MPTHGDGGRALLRWYPESWRARYGDELVALVDDEARGRPLSASARIDLASAGLRERVRATGLLGGPDTSDDVRLGALVVLSAWSLFVIGGIGFQNLSENYGYAVSGTSNLIATVAFDALIVASGLGVVVIVLGALAAFPSFVNFMRAGQWPRVRRRFGWAVAATAAEAAALAALLPWAHQLSYAQRNGALVPYSMAVVGFALLTSTMLATWTVAVVATARRLEFTSKALSVEGGLALVLFALMLTMTAAASVWWMSVGTSAPWFLQGTSRGTASSAITLNLVVSVGCMVTATAVAGAGARRIAWHRRLVG